MKDILGHRSWNYKEVVAILRRSHNFTCCVLPHYRYDRVKSICRRLAKQGWIEKSGRTDVAVNYRTTEKFKTFHDGSDLV